MGTDRGGQVAVHGKLLILCRMQECPDAAGWRFLTVKAVLAEIRVMPVTRQ